MNSSVSTTQSQSTERLSFTIFVALAVHALIVFGCTFSIDKSTNVAPTLNITLATHKSESEPDKADFIAQNNQLASGSKKEAKELTTTEQAAISDVTINQVNPKAQQKKIVQSEDQRKLIDTVFNKRHQVLDSDNLANEEKLKPKDGFDQQSMSISEKAATLKARHDRQKQQYAKIPRIMRMTSVASKSSLDAKYLLEWTRKVEAIGQNHLPTEAIEKGVVGDVLLAVSVLPNGQIDKVEILHSSGFSPIDDAALQIVRLASPFNPLTKEMRSNYDKLEIIRTWQFRASGLTTR